MLGSKAPASRRVAAVALLIAASLTARPASAETPHWPTTVTAVYKITYLGVDIGSFQFASTIHGSTYSLSGDAQLSALLGAFTWKGSTRTSGTLAGESMRPAGYNFDFKSNSKSGSVKIGFNEAGVSNLSVVPPSNPSPEHVPLREPHLKQVLDPLSAVMAISRNPGASPCGRKVSIFDGKQRFDLHLSFRGQQRVVETRPSGQPGFAYVCRVRYIPIAGHRNNDESKQMADNANIELALRPVPSANLLIPYRISIPTFAGAAVMTAQRVEITTQGKAQIALMH